MGDFRGSIALIPPLWDLIQISYAVTQMNTNNEERLALARKIQAFRDFTLCIYPQESQDNTSLPPLEQLNRLLAEMAHDFNNLLRVIEYLFLHIEILRDVALLRLDLAQTFFQKDKERGDPFVREIINSLIERQNKRMQLVSLEGQRGAKAREGASEGGRTTRQRGQQKHETWRAMASEIWQNHPSLSIRAVADRIARQCQGNPEIEGKADTIRPRIKDICPASKKS
jgi:hypothetical protein